LLDDESEDDEVMCRMGWIGGDWTGWDWRNEKRKLIL